MSRLPKAESVTIAIRTLNEERNIDRCLEALSKQTYMPDEILIIDNGSTDSTLKVIADHRTMIRMQIIHNPHKGYSAGLNLAARKVKSDYIVYLSADCIPNKRWLEFLLNTKDKYNAAVVMGQEELPIKNNRLHEVLESEKKKHRHHETIKYFNNTNTLYSLNILKEFLPFEGKYGGEDTLMALKFASAGQIAAIDPRATVIHDKFKTSNEFKKRMFYHGKSSIELFKIKPFSPRLYLNSYYWAYKELVSSIVKRDYYYLKVAWWRALYTLRGMIGLKM